MKRVVANMRAKQHRAEKLRLRDTRALVAGAKYRIARETEEAAAIAEINRLADLIDTIPSYTIEDAKVFG